MVKEEYGKEYTWTEASEAAHNILRYAEVLLEIATKEQRRQKRLEEEPKGFHLNGEGYTCSICGQSASNEQSWYDKYGIKCMICQRAIDRNEIPASLAKNRESWYSKYEIESAFNVKGPTLRYWVKAGILKARTVTCDGKGVHMQLFLIKDNKGTLPPKKMVESQMVKDTSKGEGWFRVEPWYRYVDLREHLKGYKIMDYLCVAKEEVSAKA